MDPFLQLVVPSNLHLRLILHWRFAVLCIITLYVLMYWNVCQPKNCVQYVRTSRDFDQFHMIYLCAEVYTWTVQLVLFYSCKGIVCGLLFVVYTCRLLCTCSMCKFIPGFHVCIFCFHCCRTKNSMLFNFTIYLGRYVCAAGIYITL